MQAGWQAGRARVKQEEGALGEAREDGDENKDEDEDENDEAAVPDDE